MNKTEKQFKKYMEKQIQVKDSYQDIVKKIDFEEGEKNMSKKKSIPIICGGVTVAVVACVCVFGLGDKPSVDPKARSIVSVDVNPSIELVVDDQNKVMSITGLNEDGKMIVLNEEIVGKTLDEALEIIITIEKETGFLISGRVEAGENEIKISVDADTSKISNEIESQVRTTIGTICDELNVNENITKLEKYNRQLLEERVVEIDPTLEEKVSEMSYEELLKVIQVYHLETSDIYSQKLEELYIDVKNSEISFTEKDSIKTLITNMDSAYQSFLAVYADLVDSLKTLSGNLENLRYNLLVDPNSDYQKAVNEVNNAKLELNALKQEIANLESPSVIKVIELTAKETALEMVTSGLEIAETATNTALDAAHTAVNNVIVNLEEQEANFPAEIKTELTNKAQEIETNLNTSKDEFFKSFEDKYGEDIERIKEEVETRKQALIDSLKA